MASRWDALRPRTLMQFGGGTLNESYTARFAAVSLLFM